MSQPETVYKFHQFTIVEKGPVNSSITNLLTGDIYQMATHLIETFEAQNYEDIGEFIISLRELELIIAVPGDTYIAPLFSKKAIKSGRKSLVLELAPTIDIEKAYVIFDKEEIHISVIHVIGENAPDSTYRDIPVVFNKSDFSHCKKLSTVTEHFPNCDEHSYVFNTHYNSCWGKKIAVTGDGKIRPCFYSSIVIGDMSTDSFEQIWETAQHYRQITKDKVEKCKICEFKYVCFDCREIAFQRTGNLFAANPYCPYDPSIGKWNLK